MNQEAILVLLEEIRDTLDNYSDVRDGEDGQPRANSAMSMMREVDDALLRIATHGITS